MCKMRLGTSKNTAENGQRLQGAPKIAPYNLLLITHQGFGLQECWTFIFAKFYFDTANNDKAK